MAKIMMFDDDVELVGNLSAFLQSKGHVLTTAHAVDGALEKVRKFKPDLLIRPPSTPRHPAPRPPPPRP